ncbi:MAG: arginyltransferase [Candidatus Obscuribacterales bacterium]|nr:arginyltransferase [Candidatus Obscuribacterales bacterium]MBX9951848.1 arginyltransferase [Candidatus Obscuribacterales bacterium]
MKDPEILYSYVAHPSQCGYLPDETWQLKYAMVHNLTPDKYWELINTGWRRFGQILFRPACPSCTACQPIRVLTKEYQPNRSQRRLIKQNENTVELKVQVPSLNDEKLSLYMRHHQSHSQTKGWPAPSLIGGVEHLSSIIEGPFPVEEWCYYIDGKLVSVSYMDALKDGFSGIYFYWDPDYKNHRLGTWILITMIKRAAELNLPYAYLGYFVKGCRSMEYKGHYTPSEILYPDGTWRLVDPMNQ